MSTGAPQTPGPVAEDVRRKIVEDISIGRLRPGDRLGSERDLAMEFGVSRSTLRQVLAALEEAGMVKRLPGRSGGTFVGHAKVDRDLRRVDGLPAYLQQQGYSAGTRVLSTALATADGTTRAALGLPGGALVHDIVRLRLADGSPISLEHCRLRAELFPDLLEQPLGGSLYELLDERYDVAPSESEEQIEVVLATPYEAELLGVAEAAPLLSVTRTTKDQHGTPFEFSHDLFRADRTRITVSSPGRGLRGAGRRDGTIVELRTGA